MTKPFVCTDLTSVDETLSIDIASFMGHGLALPEALAAKNYDSSVSFEKILEYRDQESIRLKNAKDLHTVMAGLSGDAHQKAASWDMIHFRPKRRGGEFWFDLFLLVGPEFDQHIKSAIQVDFLLSFEERKKVLSALDTLSSNAEYKRRLIEFGAIPSLEAFLATEVGASYKSDVNHYLQNLKN